MHILVTNDDGIMAPGLLELAKTMTKLGEVIVVAPTEEKSATGHGITVHQPLRIKEFHLPGIGQAWAVTGTPADCVKLGLKELVSKECSLVISGINNGPNLGTDVLYSGTVSAAIEGVLLGIPSIAVSLASYEADDYKLSAEVALFVAEQLYANKETLPPDTLLNINVPSVPRERLKGYKVTKLGIREYENVFDKRTDPRGRPYYWLAGDIIPSREEDPEIDLVAVEYNFVSVTPIHFDLTNYRIINKVKEWGIEAVKP